MNPEIRRYAWLDLGWHRLVIAPLVLAVDMPGQDAGAARLLCALVQAGAPVAEFAPVRASLQDTYLRSARAPERSPA